LVLFWQRARNVPILYKVQLPIQWPKRGASAPHPPGERGKRLTSESDTFFSVPPICLHGLQRTAVFLSHPEEFS